MPTMVTANCAGCGATFTRRVKDKNWLPKYCSKTCFNSTGFKQAAEKAHSVLRDLRKENPKYKAPRDRSCLNCGQIIDKKPSKNRLYCSRKCTWENWRSKHRPSPLTGTTKSLGGRVRGTLKWQRRFAREKFNNSCSRCGYNKIPEILQVHHRDHDPRNPSSDNLELLCPNCHEEDHFLSKTGRFGKHDRHTKNPPNSYAFRKKASQKRFNAVASGLPDPGPTHPATTTTM